MPSTFDPSTGGRLVTTRKDFQDHVDGYNFNHSASSINLSPSITISTIQTTNVQDAMELFATLVNPPDLQDATQTVKGILKINGDISGTADSIIVSRLQGKPISSVTPNNGEVLTYDGYSQSWTPSFSTTVFTAGGDLEGTNNLQKVISLTGKTGKVDVLIPNLSWSSSVLPVINQATAVSSGGSVLQITAQNSTFSGGKGGDINISGGSPGSGGLKGGATLSLGNNADRLIQLREVASGRRILSLLNPNVTTTTEMPANTGDLVIFIKDAATSPTSGIPSGGTEVYSEAGKLWINQSDGLKFQVGSIPNPSIWGSSTDKTYSIRSVVTTSTAAAQDAFTFNIDPFTTIGIDVIIVAKKVASAESAKFNMSMAYTRNLTSVDVGTVTYADTRTTTGAASWTAPTITRTSNQLKVRTGFSSTETVTWFVVTQLSIITTSS